MKVSSDGPDKGEQKSWGFRVLLAVTQPIKRRDNLGEATGQTNASKLSQSTADRLAAPAAPSQQVNPVLPVEVQCISALCLPTLVLQCHCAA